MEVLSFVKGVGIGVAVAAPVGPMSILCMRRTLTQGWRIGLGTGVGIATGDALYALVAALGLASVTRFMLAYERPLHLAAGVFLILLALRALLAREPAVNVPAHPAAGCAAAFSSSLLLTLTNPPTIVSFVAIFTALAPRGGFVAATAGVTVVGVMLGSAAWWCGLTLLVFAARRALRPGVRNWIERLSAAILALLGAGEIRRAA